MITYEQYFKEFASKKGYTPENLFAFGLCGTDLEEFTKGYTKLACDAQIEKCSECEYPYSILETPLIELK